MAAAQTPTIAWIDKRYVHWPAHEKAFRID
jgi:hypothetical protein